MICLFRDFKKLPPNQRFRGEIYGVPLLQVVAPMWCEALVELPLGKYTQGKCSKSVENKEKCRLERHELGVEIERLFREENLSLEGISARVKMSLITVRRVCRTVRLGRYASQLDLTGPVSLSSQVPFGWVVEQGILKENPEEMRWVCEAKKLLASGKS